MIRIIAAILTLCGVLVLSMPGGSCFFWAGLGLDHHRHGEAPPAGIPELCLHHHDHDCEGHDHGEGPKRPCEPGVDTALLAGAVGFKLDPQALPEVSDFSPYWVAQPGLVFVPDAGVAATAPAGLPPDRGSPGTALLCRYLL